MDKITNTDFDHMEMFLLTHSDYTLRNRINIEKSLIGIPTETLVTYENHGVKFNIVKHNDNTYDAGIVYAKTLLTEEEIQELYDTMYSVMVERNDEDYRLDSLGIGEFRGIFLKKMEKQYLEDDEDVSFYNYVEDEIYHVVCYE